MSKNRVVNTRFWNDSWVVDQLNPLDRYILLYLYTNDKTNISGIFELPMRIMSNETGLEPEELKRMLKRLEPKVYYRDGWVVITKMIKHQSYTNKKIFIGIHAELKKAPTELVKLLKPPKDFDMNFTPEKDRS